MCGDASAANPPVQRTRTRAASGDSRIHRGAQSECGSVQAGISSAAELLRLFPFAGRAGRSEEAREWVVHRLPYVLVYEVHLDRNEVMILSVFHGAQRRD